MNDILFLLVLAAIPLTAILARTYTTSLKLKRTAPRELLDRLAALEAENRQLRERLEHVEVIVTEGEWKPTRSLDGTPDLDALSRSEAQHAPPPRPRATS